MPQPLIRRKCSAAAYVCSTVDHRAVLARSHAGPQLCFRLRAFFPVMFAPFNLESVPLTESVIFNISSKLSNTLLSRSAAGLPGTTPMFHLVGTKSHQLPLEAALDHMDSATWDGMPYCALCCIHVENGVRRSASPSCAIPPCQAKPIKCLAGSK